jgi:6-phosphofructokinase
MMLWNDGPCTGGGDATRLNAVIRAVVKTAYIYTIVKFWESKMASGLTGEDGFYSCAERSEILRVADNS